MSDPTPEGSPEYELIRAPFPMVRKLQRQLPADYEGAAYVWDIDKTWLDTRFSQLKGMLRIPFEFGIDKQALPGTTDLLHALREGASGREHRPLYFITASPPFIRKSIERKMLIDGIEFDGISYKDQVEVFRRRQFSALREHTAFKLGALLLLARAFPPGTQINLFGDDVERDALIYCLFADISAGRLHGSQLVNTQIRMGVLRQYALDVAALAERLDKRERIQGIYVNLVREPDGTRVREFDDRIVGYQNAGAAAQLLCARGLISERNRDKVEGSGVTFSGEAERDADGWWTPVEHLATGGD